MLLIKMYMVESFINIRNVKMPVNKKTNCSRCENMEKCWILMFKIIKLSQLAV